jgi:RimJ/RimL family protein N-acetyltransferase
MEHSIQAEGYGVRLRPVRMEDAPFIVWLRNSEHAKGNLGDSAVDVAAQARWLEAYYKRKDDYYFIVETLAGIPVGTYGIYNISGIRAEQGRWAIRPAVRAAAPSAVVSLDLAFFTFGLRHLRGATVATNRAVLSLNRKMGFREVRYQPAGQMIGGKEVDMVHFEVTVEDWSAAREALIPIARLAEGQVRAWEEAQRQSQCAPESWEQA